jgi:hypothetical protein
VTISDEMSVNMLVNPSRKTVRLTCGRNDRSDLNLPPRSTCPEFSIWYTQIPFTSSPTATQLEFRGRGITEQSFRPMLSAANRRHV